MVRAFPDKKISSINQIPTARMPVNPNCVDLLIIDSQREHSRVHTLVETMELLRNNNEMHANIHAAIHDWVEASRKLNIKRSEELLYTRIYDDVDRLQYEAVLAELSLAVAELCVKTRAARTALWCAYITLIYEGTRVANGSGDAVGKVSAPLLLAPALEAPELETPEMLAGKLLDCFDLRLL